MSLARFERLAAREVRRIPPRFRRGIAAFFVEPQACQPRKDLPGLYVLGHYHRHSHLQGPTVTLYYGSFRKVFRKAGSRVIRREIARTIAHELLHHWEAESGYDALGEEDRKKLAHWAARMGYHDSEVRRHDLAEALLFLFLVLLGIAVASRMME